MTKSLEKYHQLGKKLTEELRLQTFPLAIKLVKSVDEFPEKTRRPSMLGMRIAMCQGFTMSRRIGWTLGLTAEDMKCTPNLLAYGFVELEDPKALVEAFQTMGYHKSDKAISQWQAQIPRLSTDEYVGVVISPLGWTKVQPDVVLIYGNSAQVMRLIQAANYSKGETVTSSFSGFLASCGEGVLRPFLTKRPQVVIPGGGDRVFAAAQDHEVIFSIPSEQLEETVGALRKAGYAAGMRYPVPISLTEPPMVPEAWAILDRKLKPRK